MENLNNTNKNSDNVEKELRISDVRNSILERIEELNKNCEWCLYQITGENRINKKHNSHTLQNWVRQLKENEVRIDELQQVLKNYF